MFPITDFIEFITLTSEIANIVWLSIRVVKIVKSIKCLSRLKSFVFEAATLLMNRAPARKGD